MMTREEAIQRAQKLLALATSDNPNEAAAAAARAQEILDRYEIDAALLVADGTVPEPEDEPIVDFGAKLAPVDEMRRIASWRYILAHALADVNACKTYIRKHGTGPGIQIVGRPSDVTKVRYLYEYLRREIDRLAARDGRGCGREWNYNYRRGATDTLAARLREERDRVHADYRGQVVDNPQALVRVNQAIARVAQRSQSVVAWAKSNMNLRRSSMGGVNPGRGGYGEGREAGREVRLSGARGALGSGAKQLGSR